MSEPVDPQKRTPTGKRQRTGAATTTTASYEAKKVDTPDGEDNKGNGVVSFLPEVVQEMRKVIWPTAREMVTYTLVVFGFLIILTALVFGVDAAAGWGVEQILVP
ncbi:preprotein translocase subunit SecE [Corynebacterium renale]|uniref:preprotein translocase subunit SecE n=1 Tax=Corynebacterium renale TaxID=1724 RepID=UPI0006545B36|nr:preprotein translocase subunit SecE [Corynebacterium renale]